MKLLRLSGNAILCALIAAAALAFSTQASAVEREQSVMCLKTNTGKYFPVIRVAFMVAVDGKDRFEIVLRDGVGETNVQSVTFEKNKQRIDLDKYKRPSSTSGYPTPDFTKKIYMFTNTGKYFTFTSLPTLRPKAGTDKYDVVFSNVTEPNVSKVWFVRNDLANEITGLEEAPTATEEQLQLLTPVRQQIQISGCGDAALATVYSTSGTMVAEAGVSNGTATIQVGHLTKGAYIVKVGNKSLKFMKK